MPALSIGVRLAATAAIVVAGALASFGAIAYFAVAQTLFHGVDPIVDGELDEVARAIAEGVDRDGVARAVLLEGQEHASAEVAFRAVDAATGAEIARHGVTAGAVTDLPWRDIPGRAFEAAAGHAGSPATSDQRETATIASDDVRWRISRRRIVGSKAGAVVIEVASRMRGAEHVLQRLRRTALFATPFALTLSLLAGLFVARRALAPLAALDAAAAKIGAGPPGARLPRSGSGDELDRLANQLDGMLGRLEAASERNRRFAADVAHEVRTPVSAARVRVESAGKAAAKAAVAPEVQSRLDEALAALDRVEALIASLLLICRADEGALNARFDEVDLAAVARDTVEFFAPLAESKGGSLTIEAPASGPHVRGDGTALGRALASLVDNAIRHAGGEVKVRVPAASGGWAHLEVLDRGGGIPEESRDRLFGRFYRVDETREGTGLGLALVRAIARAHGGEASYTSRPDGGSIFSIELPESSRERR